MLQLWLLGQFDVKADGKRAVIPTRAAQSLLAFLVLNAGAAQRREKLAGLLFPEMSDETARNNLRHALWRVRKALPSPSTPQGEYLLAEELTITFNPKSDYWLDVAQLERATSPDDSVDELVASMALYRGELLPGFYDDWAALERERVQAVFEGKMQKLLERLIAEKRWATVLEWAERWLALGQTPEPAYRALMIAHAAQGNMSQVALDYERCVERLGADLGVEPSADTRALYETLAAGGKTATIAPSVPPILVQPSGTVTFLFSDIEGSTKLLEQLGSDYATLLADQRDLLRETAEKYHGHEVDTQGDAFFFAFFRAADAVSFAAEAQRALAAHAWPQGATLRVRMGLHTGEPMLARTGYVGLDVHRAARIGSAGHGGQVLMSRTTRDLVEQDLPARTQLDDLGEHQLKDLRYPVHIIQLTIEDLPSDFPPLKVVGAGNEPPAPGEPPFKGLEYFGENDADVFFGREQLTAKLVGRLRESNFLAVVVGASGSGKSSIVRAGVLPALRRGEPLADGTLPPTDGQNWRIHIITPTAQPLLALATELTRDVESVTATATLLDDLAREPRALYLYLRRNTDDQRPQTADRRRPKADGGLPSVVVSHTLIVIDQFEELFTLCHDDLVREQFVDNLLAALSEEAGGRVTICLTLRADFYAHLAQFPELRDAVTQNQEYIGPMSVDELRRAIEEPAKRRTAADGGSWEFEPGLVDLMLRDVGDEPGALPLLSHALLETWKRRSGHTLTLKGYHEAGGVRGAIALTAETTYQSLTPEQQEIARSIFLRLTELGEGTEDTRRRSSFDELIPRGPEGNQVRGVLTKLADARLITTSAESAEVAHEALIREWDRLREWLNQDREGLHLHRQITEAAHEWELLERDPGALYRGSRLAAVVEFANANAIALNAGERAFLEASEEDEKREASERQAQQERELEAARKLAETQKSSSERLRRRALLLAGALLLALLAAGAALFFGNQSSQNAAAEVRARATAVANEQIAKTNALVADAARLEAEKEKRFSLARELAASAITNLESDPERSILLALQAVETTRDTDKVVLREAEEALHRAVMTSRILRTWTNPDGVPSKVVFSPDGKTFAVNDTAGKIRLFDLASGDELIALPIAPEYWNNMFFSPDGTQLATMDVPGLETVTAKVFDLKTGELVRETPVGVAFENAYFGSFSPDWTRVAFGQFDGNVTIWDFETGELVQTLPAHAGQVKQVLYSPDGTQILTLGQEDGLAKLWDASTGAELLTWQGPVEGVFEAAFSSDGKRIGIAALDQTARVLDAETAEELLTLRGHKDWVTDIAFSRDGSRIMTTSYDRTAKVWDGETGQELTALAGHNGFVRRGAINSDGTRVVTTSLDQTMKTWDLTPSHEALTISHQSPVGSDLWFPQAKYSPQGDRLAAPYKDGSIIIWDAATGKQVLTLKGHPDPVGAVVFSPDGSRLASGSWDNTAKIWDLTTGNELLTFRGHKGDINAVVFSPDGKYVATGDLVQGNQIGTSVGQSVKIWDASTGEVVKTFPTESYVQSMAYSPDGSQLLVSNHLPDDTYIVTNWDLTEGKPVFTRIIDTQFWVNVASSPDGSRWVASADAPGTHIYDSVTGKELVTLGDVLTPSDWATFSPDGTVVATAHFPEGEARLWDAATGKQLLTLYADGNVPFVAFSPDGTRLALSSQDDIRVYLLKLEDLIALAKTRVTWGLTAEECTRFLHVEQCP